MAALVGSLEAAEMTLQDGDVLAISSKYASIASGRTVSLAEIATTPRAEALAGVTTWMRQSPNSCLTKPSISSAALSWAFS